MELFNNRILCENSFCATSLSPLWPRCFLSTMYHHLPSLSHWAAQSTDLVRSFSKYRYSRLLYRFLACHQKKYFLEQKRKEKIDAPKMKKKKNLILRPALVRFLKCPKSKYVNMKCYYYRHKPKLLKLRRSDKDVDTGARFKHLVYWTVTANLHNNKHQKYIIFMNVLNPNILSSGCD